MACTTILAGRKATYDGSTMIARNDDSGAGCYTPKKLVVISRQEQKREYKSVISKVEILLPENPMAYTAVPNAVEGKGIWAASGVNEAGVGMTATETITSNPRVLGADPLVTYKPVSSGEKPENNEKADSEDDGDASTTGGIGEEDIVYITLPYIRSAREGVIRLGSLLEQYGTYEMNGIAFQDRHEIWWLETIGGHHWIARRVPDDQYVVMPNQFGMDCFDFDDAYSEQKNYMCSSDLKQFVIDNYLDVSGSIENSADFNPRLAFGSHDDSDHVYNTPRGWYAHRCLNPHGAVWDGENRDFGPLSDNIPWSMIPERLITPEDIKYVLSSHYQGTAYDPYGAHMDSTNQGAYRSIGINRNDFMSLIQMRPDEKDEIIEWIAFASNAFNTMVPFFTAVDHFPDYVSYTEEDVSTDSFYWTSRMIAAMADASYSKSIFSIERYAQTVVSIGHGMIEGWNRAIKAEPDEAKKKVLREMANQQIADELRQQAAQTLKQVLDECSNQMKNAYARSDS